MAGVIRADEREAAFREAFTRLLLEHGAEYDLTDDGRPWGMHSPVFRITMTPKWNDAGDLTLEYTEFNL